ncbi:hypothetical protein GBAR_LOCUS31817, partial [Geodia barretti]
VYTASYAVFSGLAASLPDYRPRAHAPDVEAGLIAQISKNDDRRATVPAGLPYSLQLLLRLTLKSPSWLVSSGHYTLLVKERPQVYVLQSSGLLILEVLWSICKLLVTLLFQVEQLKQMILT